MKDNQTYREDEGTPSDQWSNMQIKQPPHDLSPADGGNGFVGSNTGAGIGLQMVEGKKGSVTSKPIWSQQTDYVNNGAGSPDDRPSGQDPTDEFAPYKKIQTDEGLPQTFRTSKGAGDAGPSGSDEPDRAGGVFGKGGSNQGHPDTQDHPSPEEGEASFSDMPQTEFTHNDGGGAPRWKR